MGFRLGDRDDIERAIMLFFRLSFLTLGTLILMALLNWKFGLKPGLLSAALSGGIAGGLGHVCGLGAVALFGLIWPPGGRRKKSASQKNKSTPGKRRKRQSLRPVDDE